MSSTPVPAEAMDVFSVYIEMIQNIRQYAAQNGDTDACATVVIYCRDESRYVVSAGNLVRIEDGNALVARVQELAALDKAELKAAYKAQLHKPRAQGVASGAGLGLIDIARRSGAPMEASLTPAAGEGTAFFSLSAVI
ncbi:SiaB family protein kinase [Achromobacter xylosoxidans]